MIATNDLYGGTYRIFARVFSQFNIHFETINTQDLNEVEVKMSEKPKFILIESPTNPLLNISDIAAISKIAKKAWCVGSCR